jgi:hypothetical protein
MTLYQIQKTIDVHLHTDEDGELALHEIVGLPVRIDYVKPHVLRSAGFEVREITRPEDDPPGTVRKFVLTGDFCIKDVSGRWLCVCGDLGGTITRTDVESASSEVVTL